MKKFLILTMLVLTGTFMAIALNSNVKTDSSTATQETYDCKRCGGTGIDPMTQTCPVCKGAKKGTVSKWCEPCSGSGVVKDRFGDDVTCPTCKGQKMMISVVECETCHGTGTAEMKCMSCKGAKKVTR